MPRQELPWVTAPKDPNFTLLVGDDDESLIENVGETIIRKPGSLAARTRMTALTLVAGPPVEFIQRLVTSSPTHY